jgi:hypothetical protein
VKPCLKKKKRTNNTNQPPLQYTSQKTEFCCKLKKYNTKHKTKHFIPTRIAITKNGNKITMLVKNLEPWRIWNAGHCWLKYKMIQPLWKTIWRFLKILNVGLPYDPAIPFLTAGTQTDISIIHLCAKQHYS